MICHKLVFSVVVSCSSLFGAQLSQEVYTRRIYDHLLIKDHRSAIEEGAEALALYPNSQDLTIAYFRALCEEGEEMRVLEVWEKIDPERKKERAILESFAWGVLNKAKKSSQLEMRLNVLMAASCTKDVKAIPYILNALKSSNAIERDVAIHMAVNFRDAPLKERMRSLFKQETLWYLRLSLMRAMGQLRMKEMKQELQAVLLDPKVSVEERTGAQLALMQIYDTIEEEELDALVKSPRAFLRQLACQLIAYLECADKAFLLYPLLQDTHSSVRIAAINALTLLNDEKSFTYIEPCLEDSAFDVAITAAWSALLFKQELGEKKLAHWLKSREAEARRMAAGALLAAGKRGVSLAEKSLRKSKDDYVKMTLAVALIRQRSHLLQAQELLYTAVLKQNIDKWMWDAGFNPLFPRLVPSRLRHREGIAHFPHLVDQLVRLELLSLLCMTEYAHAEEAVRGYLQKYSWGITGAAATILLEEGNEHSIEISHKLLEDPEEEVRLEAAFILAFMGKNEEVLPILYAAYPKLSRAMKEQVLEAIAEVGELSSISFLLERLKEPFQSIRVSAASAIIRCLYR